MPHQERENLVGIYERAGSVDRANAVAIAVGRKARVIFPSLYRLLQWRDMRFNRFGMCAAEARVARAANFMAFDSVASEKFRQQTGRGSVHCVERKPEVCFA